MKTDNYLTLCLEQASKSPLHYRHGCIVVRGGKVIGQGYNDYRPGFNGGALKTGRIAAGAFDGPALSALKEKHKQNKKQQLQPQQQDLALPITTGTTTFTPFEAMAGGGHLANTPLSMHSEMSAIHSALTATTALGSSAFSSQKPCFKLPGLSKRKERLRREAVAAFKSAVLKRVHVDQVREYKGNDNDRYEYGYKAGQREKDGAFQVVKGGEKHQGKKKKKKGKKEEKHGGQNQNHHHRSGGQQGQQEQLSAFKQSCRTPRNKASSHAPGNSSSSSNSSSTPSTRTPSPSSISSTNRINSRKNIKNHNESQPPRPPTSLAQPTLLPTGRSGTHDPSSPSVSVRDRQKHPRLKGAVCTSLA